MAREDVERGEEVASNEEGLLGERERVKVMESEREERWGREDGTEAEMVVVGDGDDGVAEIGEIGRTKSGE